MVGTTKLYAAPGRPTRGGAMGTQTEEEAAPERSRAVVVRLEDA
jgi:hypothetical protein